MKLTKGFLPFIILIILGLCVMIISVFDILYDKGWIIITLASYAVLIVLIMLIFCNISVDFYKHLVK